MPPSQHQSRHSYYRGGSGGNGGSSGNGGSGGGYNHQHNKTSYWRWQSSDYESQYNWEERLRRREAAVSRREEAVAREEEQARALVREFGATARLGVNDIVMHVSELTTNYVKDVLRALWMSGRPDVASAMSSAFDSTSSLEHSSQTKRLRSRSPRRHTPSETRDEETRRHTPSETHDEEKVVDKNVSVAGTEDQRAEMDMNNEEELVDFDED